MTAAIPAASLASEEVVVHNGSPPGSSALEDFLRDPIGYGSYDHTDPIQLDDFSTARHYHGVFAAPLT